MACRLFIDEVGNSDLRGAAADDNVRYLSLTGILTKRDLYDRAITPMVGDLKQDIFGRSDILFHRREIMRREGPFKVLRDEHLKLQFDAGILRLIDDCPYRAITVAIDKRDHLATYGVWHFDPYHYCLRCLIGRYVLWLHRHAEVGDVAIEPRFPKADKKVKNSFALIYDRGTEHLPPSLVQSRLTSRDIKFVGKRENCPAMQLCDLLAHPSYRSMKFEREGVDLPEDFGGSVAAILRARRYLRNPYTHVITGWGTKWLP